MKPFSNKKIGKSIRILRINSGLSKRKFAKFLGTNNVGLAKIERRMWWPPAG